MFAGWGNRTVSRLTVFRQAGRRGAENLFRPESREGRRSMQIDRSRIVDRVQRSEARLVSLVAPAGFGKSTVARAIAALQEQRVVIDAGGVSGVAHFARRVVHAIQAVLPERAEALATDLYAHLQPGVTTAQISGFLLDAAAALDERKSVIFENLESIAKQPECLDLLVRLLKACRHGIVILCARPPFSLVNSRLFPPNIHLRLGIDDLAFTRDEVSQLIGRESDGALLDSVMKVTRGWPVAVLLFRQLARIGQLAPALEHSAGTELDDLRDYLLNEVLGAIQGPLFDALVALVATRSLGLDAAQRATAGAAGIETLRELARNLPLVSLAPDGESYDVHPLIVALIEARAAAAVEHARCTAAKSYRTDGRFGEAARLFLDCGDMSAAAAALEAGVGPFIRRNVIAGFDDIVEHLPVEILVHYPRLWALLAVIRRGAVSVDVLMSEGLVALDGVGDSASLEAQQIGALLILLATQRGRQDLVDRLNARFPIDEFDIAPGNLTLLCTDTMHDVMTGHTRHAMERYRFTVPLIQNDLFRAYFKLRTEAVIATIDGRFDDALLAQVQVLQAARAAGKANIVAGMAQHQAVVAWLAGDDARFEDLIDEMRRTGATVDSVSYAEIVAAWDTGATEKLLDALPRTRAFNLLMVAGKTVPAERRSAILDEALQAANDARDLWGEVLITLAIALTVAGDRTRALERAAAIALEIGRPRLTESIASLSAGGSGAPTLEAFARRFARADGQASVTQPAVRVNVLSRTVYRGDQRLSVSNRALSLIVALAVLGNIPRDDAIEMLWGDGEIDNGPNALKMLVSRARRQLGDPGLIVVENGVYGLRPDVAVDFHQIQHIVDSLPPHHPLTGTQREALQRAYDQFKPAWLSKESAPAIDAAISGVRHRVVERLANDALDRNEIAQALGFADELRRRDGNDETAYELLIRAHLRLGNSAGALREYRIYSEHLQRDLGVEPSFSIEDLLQAAS
jgi:DNA-binding SARP family transcriptional activator